MNDMNNHTAWTIEQKPSEAWPSLAELSSRERGRFSLPPLRHQFRRTVSRRDGNCQQRYGGVGPSLQDLGGVRGYPRHWRHRPVVRAIQAGVFGDGSRPLGVRVGYSVPGRHLADKTTSWWEVIFPPLPHLFLQVKSSNVFFLRIHNFVNSSENATYLNWLSTKIKEITSQISRTILDYDR